MILLTITKPPLVRSLILETLTQKGWGPTFVATCSEAWRLIKKREDIRIVIVDLNMPGMDGINDAFSPKRGKSYGLEKAKRILTENYTESLKISFDRLVSEVLELIGHDGFSDDISLIGFKRLDYRVN